MALLFTILFAGAAAAQVRPPTDSLRPGVVRVDTLPDTVVVDTPRFAPGKAFLRSVMIPGWGQASVNAYVRGGTFFALQTVSAYMLLRTRGRIGEAKERTHWRFVAIVDSLRRVNEEEPTDSLKDAARNADNRWNELDGLIDARRQQRQDWTAYLLVFTLASGVDAFVAAHLADFPQVEIEPTPTGGVQLGFRLPTGFPP